MGRAMTEGGERSIWVVAIEESNALRDPLRVVYKLPMLASPGFTSCSNRGLVT